MTMTNSPNSSAAQASSSETEMIREGLRAASANNLPLATKLLIRAIEAYPQSARAANELGVLYYRQKDIEHATAYFERATQLNPVSARFHTNLGSCQHDSGRYDSAIKCHETALDIDPTLADAWANLGNTYNAIREHEMSVYCYRKALSIRKSPTHLTGLGSAYRLSGRYDRAKQCFRQTLELEPDNAFAHTALAALYFYDGDYPNAFSHYEWRWKLPSMREEAKKYAPYLKRPGYTGQDLSQQRVLLLTEQGYGDCILFSRYINMLKPLSGELGICCNSALAPLFQRNFDFDFVTTKIEEQLEFDIHIPLLSLPHFFDNQLTELGEFSPYLHPTPFRPGIENFDASAFNIGLVWGCDHKGFDYRFKKLPLEQLAPLTEINGCQFHGLQLGPDQKDLASSELTNTIRDLSPLLTDFQATADIIDAMDLIISVDTATAHLAGAMGKPTWVALKKNPDWRWHGFGEKSLWYPCARLYRQISFDDWSHVVGHMRRDLIALTNKHRTRG